MPAVSERPLNIEQLTRDFWREVSKRLTREHGRAFKQYLANHGLYTIQIGLNSVIGYIFARFLAARFGTSSAKDGFDIAYSVPFLILGMGGFTFFQNITTAAFSKAQLRKGDDLNELFSTGLNLVLLVLSAVVIPVFLFSSRLTDLLAPGLSFAARNETRHLILFMAPLSFAFAVASYLSGILIAFGIPFTADLLQLFSRLCVVILGLMWRGTIDLRYVALALLVTGFIALFFQIAVLYSRTSLRYKLCFAFRNQAMQGSFAQAQTFVAAAVLAQISMSYMRRLATLAGAGQVASLTYALSLVIPAAYLLGRPFSFVFGPAYIRAYESRNALLAKRLLVGTILIVGIGTSALAFLIQTQSVRLVRILYGGGNFDLSSTATTAGVVVALSWTLPAAVLLIIVVLPLLARERSRVPGLLYCLGYSTQIVVSRTLYPEHGVSGLATGYMMASVVPLAGAFVLLYRDLQRI